MKKLAVVLVFCLIACKMLAASPKAAFEKYGMKNAFPGGFTETYSSEDDDYLSCYYEFTKYNCSNIASNRLQFTNGVIKSVLASHPDATTTFRSEYYDDIPLKTLAKAPEEWDGIDISISHVLIAPLQYGIFTYV